MNFFFILILFLLPFMGNAQLFLGTKVGVSLTNVSRKPIFGETQFRIGFSGGGTLDYLFAKYFTLNAELLFQQKGFRFDTQFTDDMGNPTGKSTGHLICSYLSFPVKAGIFVGKKVFIFGNAGLCPSMLVYAINKSPVFNSNRKVDINIRNGVAPIDVSLIAEFGGGYTYKSKFGFNTSLVLQHSVNSFIKTNSATLSNNLPRHYGITWNFGVKIPCSF